MIAKRCTHFVMILAFIGGFFFGSVVSAEARDEGPCWNIRLCGENYSGYYNYDRYDGYYSNRYRYSYGRHYGYGGLETELLRSGAYMAGRVVDGLVTGKVSGDQKDVAMAGIHTHGVLNARPGHANVSSSWGHMAAEYDGGDGVGQSTGAGNQRYYDSQPEQQVQSPYSRVEQLRQQAAEDYVAGEGIPYTVFDSMSPEARRAYGQTWDALEDARHETGVYYAKSRRRIPTRKPRSGHRPSSLSSPLAEKSVEGKGEDVVGVEAKCLQEMEQAHDDWRGFVEKGQKPPLVSPFLLRSKPCYAQTWAKWGSYEVDAKK